MTRDVWLSINGKRKIWVKIDRSQSITNDTVIPLNTTTNISTLLCTQHRVQIVKSLFSLIVPDKQHNGQPCYNLVKENSVDIDMDSNTSAQESCLNNNKEKEKERVKEKEERKRKEKEIEERKEREIEERKEKEIEERKERENSNSIVKIEPRDDEYNNNEKSGSNNNQDNSINSNGEGESEVDQKDNEDDDDDDDMDLNVEMSVEKSERDYSQMSYNLCYAKQCWL